MTMDYKLKNLQKDLREGLTLEEALLKNGLTFKEAVIHMPRPQPKKKKRSKNR